MDRQHINTDMGSSHSIITTSFAIFTKESCHLRTPTGRQYTIMEGFHIPGIEVIASTNDIGCGVTVTVESEDLIGEWELIARETRYREPVEIRQPFTIYVEGII